MEPSLLGLLLSEKRLEACFFPRIPAEHPSRRMRTIGLVGSYGKTTSSWLMRGMFEEAEELVGMVGEWLAAAGYPPGGMCLRISFCANA